MLYGLAIFIFVVICVLLMGIILLQSSKSGGMGSAMGGTAMNTAFGGQGADKLLVKITTALAISFMGLAMIIGMMDNPASRIEYSNEPTLSRNKGATTVIDNNRSLELAPIDKSTEEVPLNKDTNESE